MAITHPLNGYTILDEIVHHLLRVSICMPTIIPMKVTINCEIKKTIIHRVSVELRSPFVPPHEFIKGPLQVRQASRKRLRKTRIPRISKIDTRLVIHYGFPASSSRNRNNSKSFLDQLPRGNGWRYQDHISSNWGRTKLSYSNIRINVPKQPVFRA
jgi:hypothetical protein